KILSINHGFAVQSMGYTSPFMVKLFEGLLSKVMSSLKIEEMLLNSEPEESSLTAEPEVLLSVIALRIHGKKYKRSG
ncbi:MAG: hypothetical protein H9535_08375, partial [Ignavibacteria bacterium]|nr:hypothetical protein [Ignavibacteria bacterium]